MIQGIEYLAPLQKASKRRLAEQTIELTLDKNNFLTFYAANFFKMKSRHLAATGYSCPKKALSSAFPERNSRTTYFKEYIPPSVFAKPVATSLEFKSTRQKRGCVITQPFTTCYQTLL